MADIQSHYVEAPKGNTNFKGIEIFCFTCMFRCGLRFLIYLWKLWNNEYFSGLNNTNYHIVILRDILLHTFCLFYIYVYTLSSHSQFYYGSKNTGTALYWRKPLSMKLNICFLNICYQSFLNWKCSTCSHTSHYPSDPFNPPSLPSFTPSITWLTSPPFLSFYPPIHFLLVTLPIHYNILPLLPHAHHGGTVPQNSAEALNISAVTTGHSDTSLSGGKKEERDVSSAPDTATSWFSA